MIKVVLFDLGGTLVNAQQKPFAHVPEALAAIGNLHNANGKALRSALVSDFKLVTAPPTATKIAPVFAQYLALLSATGLREFFEPVARRVTLSTHVGLMKPARAVFEKALSRLQSKAPLTECLFITEDAAHVTAARLLGLHALRFGTPGTVGADFSDWSQAPALVAHLLGGSNPANLHTAIGAHLAALGVQVTDVQSSAASPAHQVHGTTWHTIAVPGHKALQAVQLAVPMQAHVTRGPHGALTAQLPATDAAALTEATDFVASLAAHGQIEGVGAQRGKTTATHQLHTDDQGRCTLVRKRFTAF